MMVKMFAATQMSQLNASKAISKATLAITANIASLFVISYELNINKVEAININSSITLHKATTGDRRELVAVRPSSNFDSRISATLLDSRDRLWLGTWQGLIQIDQLTGKAISSIS